MEAVSIVVFFLGACFLFGSIAAKTWRTATNTDRLAAIEHYLLQLNAKEANRNPELKVAAIKLAIERDPTLGEDTSRSH